MNDQYRKTIENLPEELELTEYEWYEYHYYKKRNLFLLNRIMNLPYKAENIYLIEPHETYIGSVLKAFGFEIYREGAYAFQTPDFAEQSHNENNNLKDEKRNYDVLLMLNILENQNEHPKTFLARALSHLKNSGTIFMTTENIVQFRNRLKFLLGRSIFLHDDDSNPCSFRKYGIYDLMEILRDAKVKILDSRFVNLYPPFKMEPLTLSRYLLKYFNYFIMKTAAELKDTIFIEATKDNT